ncbi:inorganic diphosphatase [Vagococcus acidifermentans]|uniref:inorganic diphosphatase n=1 Tax=Vagococcus acidifermentans TaxID=564710 RepID=A0A430AZJ5_9ENTE|nr:inorganic diphosphatase [Vagococcus acidifermentans]RSU13436.1 inorganic pyrophosphatase [Vagococcus acidifermentans]
MTITVIIDRPLGYEDAYHNIYPVNYGYVPNVLAGDGEPQDVYILNCSVPLHGTFTGKQVAVIHRRDDVEDKWVVIPPGTSVTQDQIRQDTFFLEQYFDVWIEMLDY